MGLEAVKQEVLNMKANGQILRSYRKQAWVGLVWVKRGRIIEPVSLGLHMRAQSWGQVGFKAGGDRAWHIQPAQQKINRKPVKSDTSPQFTPIEG